MTEKETLEEHKKLKEATKAKYDKIDKIYCPALKSYVYFNSDGFHHLRYDRFRIERKKRVQINKFKFFDDGVKIISTSTTTQEYRRKYETIGKADKSGFHKTNIIQYFGFFAILSFSKQIRSKVVIRKIGEDGQYHFWSVMPFWTLSGNVNVVGSKDIEDE